MLYVPRTVLDGTRTDIFARVTREPGHFGIITQEFRFPTLYTNRTGTMKNSTVIVPVQYAGPWAVIMVQYARPWAVIMADPKFPGKKFLPIEIDLNYLGEK